MRSIIKYSYRLLLLAVIASSCGKNNLPPLTETYSFKDKNPFGSYVAYKHLQQMFQFSEVSKVRTKFDETWNSMPDTGSLYVSISRNLYLTPTERDAMLNYVYAGNSLFISSSNIDPLLLDTLLCKIEDYAYYIDPVSVMKTTSARLNPLVFADTASYGYFYLPLNARILKYDSSVSRPLGLNEFGNTNYIVVFHGRGRFYLHCEPRLFSNYYLLKNDNYQYMLKAFSVVTINPDRLYWDDFYGKRNSPVRDVGAKTGLSYVLQHPPLASAFWLLILLLFLYIFFNGKRRQRIIPEMPPVKNTTVAFTETIGRLYLQKKDNRNIADKLITYFFEHIRNHYYLNTSHLNEEFVTILSRKSGVPRQVTDDLFMTIIAIQKTTTVADQQLLLLNAQIENFNKYKQ